MTQSDLFDAAESRRRKERGMAFAADAVPTLLDRARSFGRRHAALYGKVTADDVGAWLEQSGEPQLSAEWEFTGEFVPSTRNSNHARLLRVWRLK